MSTTIKIPCEVYSRVVGYIRPISQWNRGKREEFDDRVMLKFDVNDTDEIARKKQ